MHSALRGQATAFDANKAGSDMIIRNGDCVHDGDVVTGLARDVQFEVGAWIETVKDLGEIPQAGMNLAHA